KKATVADDTLYIDGGELKYINASTTSVTVWTVDLNKPWNNADTGIWSNITKATKAGSYGPPSLNDGAIFSNGSSLWLYGGSVSRAGPPLPAIPPDDIWRYDFATFKWSLSARNGDPIQRLTKGAYLQTDGSKGFYLAGQKDPFSDISFHVNDGAEPYMVEGLLIFDEVSETFHNASTAGMNRLGTMINGFISFIPSLGSEGLLIAFGGLSRAAGMATSFGTILNDPDVRVQMQNISLYDIAHQQWYQQEASGDIPSWRAEGCSVTVSAPDSSSFSIYVFGGWSYTNAQHNDGNVYVLSVPSFIWIRVTLDTDQRLKHQCHLMGKHHMLVVGGNRPDGDDGQPQGFAGCDTSPKFKQGLGIFSLNNHNWTTSYEPGAGARPYQIHPSISKVIGGNENGGATKRTPKAGFSSNALRDLMNPIERGLNTSTINTVAHTTNTEAHTTNTLAPEPPKAPQERQTSPEPNKGAITGIVVGVTISTLVIVGIVLYLLHRRHRPQRKGSNGSTLAERFSSTPPQSFSVNEMIGPPVGHELLSGTAEDSLARMYQSHEVSDTAEIHEMPTFFASFEMSACQGCRTIKIPPPETLHPALVNEKKRKGQGIRQRVDMTKK
ncbi:MAG: hypothetical protein Q9213_008406, partial [Squamulea squamosa]